MRWASNGCRAGRCRYRSPSGRQSYDANYKARDYRQIRGVAPVNSALHGK
ncbi:hypothetical protein C4J95_0808 [Pseudomonas orientalis]|nr:hypothetical protein C4J96_0798 [Pseudomonas orientalis]AZE98286.1 hypothetical protein C4J95_0808 [Pseudomonas orientalis]